MLDSGSKVTFFVIQLLSHVQLFATPWTIACQVPLSSTISWNLLKFMSIELVMPSIISFSAAPFSLCLQSFPAAGSFPELSDCVRWPRYWSFNFSISPSNEYSGLVSFRIDWFDLLAVQGSFKSLLQTTVQKHQFFGTQPSLWSNSHIHT